MKSALRSIAVCLFALAFSATGWAQWSSNPALNLPLADNNNGSDQVQPKLVPLQNNGWYVSWFDSNPATPPPVGYDVFYQRLSTAGVEKFQHDGIRVADLTNSSTEDYGLDADKNGNALPQYFQPRPSFAIVSGNKNDFGCDPLYSSASNYGPTNPTQVQLIQQRQKQISAFDHVPISQIPPDAVTASGSGLDPGISPANAYMQVPRVAAARHLPEAEVRNLVTDNITGRTLGFLGQPTVNVLTLNILLDQLSARSGG